jgi:phosphoglucomutase
MADREPGQLSVETINTYFYRGEFHLPSGNPARVKFGTSGHRGILGAGFSERHAEAIAQAVAGMHREHSIEGPIILGGDTRLMSAETAVVCAEVLTANGFEVILSDIPLPTPVFSSAILNGQAVASLNGTASHNPPQDMGLKYNPKTGGPAGSEITSLIEKSANEFLDNPEKIRRMSLEKAAAKGLVKRTDLIGPYLERLSRVVNLEVIRRSDLRIGIHPLGGTTSPCYRGLREKYGLENLEIVDSTLDPTFGFIPLDHDLKIRMDPSSPFPMRPLLELMRAGKYDFAGASDPDGDRFGAATSKTGLLQPNHALSILFSYLLDHRPEWPQTLEAGRTIGTTHLIDRIASARGRKVDEVNVGFKFYVDGLLNGRYALAGEESAGLSIYRWTTEKDGILAVLLLAEAMAKTGKDLADLYRELTSTLGEPSYGRIDVPVDERIRGSIKSKKAGDFKDLASLAGEKVTGVRDTDGLKIYTENSWVLARLSGTEPIAKLYAESFKGPDHLREVQKEGGRIFGLEVEKYISVSC